MRTLQILFLISLFSMNACDTSVYQSGLEPKPSIGANVSPDVQVTADSEQKPDVSAQEQDVNSTDLIQGIDAASTDTGNEPNVDVNVGPYNWCKDTDGDFYAVCDGTCVIPGNEFCGDCDDNNPSIHPDAEDTCDGKDNDCNGQTDEDCTPLGVVSPKGVCVGLILFVPYNCATIQQAVDTAAGSYGIDSSSPLTTIYVSTGTYNENIVTQGGSNIALTAVTNNEVVIDGGMQSAFIAGMSSRLTLMNVTIKSQQIITDNPPSTVFGDTGANVVLDNVKLYTHTFGLMVSYSVMTLVQNSLIVGNGPTTLAGLILDYQNIPSSETKGAHVYNNVFQNLNVAMAGCNDTKPKMSPVNASDTNSYTNVNITYQKGCLTYW